jgi:nitrate reductase gamma subunit
MEHALEFARGPLFVAAFGFMVLGLARLVAIQLWALVARSRTNLSRAPWLAMTRDLVSWALPARYAVRAPSALFVVCSFVFHAGTILLAVFLADHGALWEAATGIRLPRLGHAAADILTTATLAGLLYMLFARAFKARLRSSSDPSDYLILLLMTTCFATGYFAHHPGSSPLPWEVVMLAHVLSGNAILALIPVTKLAHVALFPFTRFSAVYWQLRPGAGDKVAYALYGSEAKV